MNWFNQLKFGPRLLLTFAALVFMMAIQAVIAWNGMTRIDHAADALASKNIRGMQALGDLRTEVSQYRNYFYQSLVRASDEVKQSGRDDAAAVRQTLESGIQAYRSSIEDAALAKEFEQFQQEWAQATASYDNVSEMVDLDLADDAIDTFVSETRQLHAQASATLEDVAERENKLAAQAQHSADEAFNASMWGLVIALLIGAAAAALMVILFVRSITARLQMAIRVTNDVASGRLDGRIDVSGKDEVSALLQAMARMQADLRERTDRDQAIARENLRIRNALEASTTGVYVTNADLDIVFANPALRTILTDNADVFNAALPQLGGDMDPTGKKVSALENGNTLDPNILDKLAKEGRAERLISFEGKDGQAVHLFQIIAAIRDTENAILGYIVEWRNRTADVIIEAEIASIIDSAANGDMDKRVETVGKRGFHLQVAENLNRLLDANADILGKLSTLLAALSAGDLRVRMNGQFEGVFASMRDDANAMAQQLTQMIGRIQQAVHQISSAAGEIASGNQDLSRRTEQQAANLEETAASMEELTATVRQNAEHARQANQLAVGAADVAARGGEVTQSMVVTMAQIDQASRKIADIISVIDGIAFQTNILALNAAVEAARAGEQGRGFAVVAAEVRTLAQRSAGAAKEIKQLIDDSVAKVSEGNALVSSAGSTMQEIVSSVQRVTDIMSEISAASQEQSAGIEQVGKTVSQMDETTQQNAALVEEATAAARAMEEQARQLSDTVSAFRTEESNTQPMPRKSTAAPVKKQESAAAAPKKAKPVSSASKARSTGAAMKIKATAEDLEWQEF